MRIIPNMNTRDWSLLPLKDTDVISVAAIHNLDTLTWEQRKGLDELVDIVFKEMDDQLGFTHLVEHVIRAVSLSIKQLY